MASKQHADPATIAMFYALKSQPGADPAELYAVWSSLPAAYRKALGPVTKPAAPKAVRKPKPKAEPLTMAQKVAQVASAGVFVPNAGGWTYYHTDPTASEWNQWYAGNDLVCNCPAANHGGRLVQCKHTAALGILLGDKLEYRALLRVTKGKIK